MTTPMLLSQEEWMDLRAYRALRAAGASWADIAREAGCDWRTVKKYLADEAPPTPPAVDRRSHPPRLIEPWMLIPADFVHPFRRNPYSDSGVFVHPVREAT